MKGPLKGLSPSFVPGNRFVQLEVEPGGIAMDSDELSRHPSGRPCNEVLDQTVLGLGVCYVVVS